MKFPKSIWMIFKKAFKAFFEDKIPKLSASLAYYTVFSISPFLFIIIMLCTLFLGPEAVQGQLYFQINQLLGEKAALQIQEMIRNVSLSGGNQPATIISAAVLLIGATGIFAEMKDTLNIIWEVKPEPRLGIWKWLINRALSLSLIVSFGFLFLVSLLASTFIQLIHERISSVFSEGFAFLVQALNFIFSFALISCLFAAIFKVLPDIKIRLKDAFVGAILTAFLFVTGKELIGYYLGSSNINHSYGAAASIVILLTWVYFSSIILFFGAEFTRYYTMHFEKAIRPEVYAKKIKNKKTGFLHFLNT